MPGQSRLINVIIIQVEHALQLPAGNHVLLSRAGSFSQWIRGLVPGVGLAIDTVVVHTFAQAVDEAVAEALAFCEKHIPFTAEEDNVVWECGEHVVGRHAWAQPGMGKIERGRLQVGVVKQGGEDGGKLVICPRARGAALCAGLGVVCGRVEGYYASDLEDGGGTFCGDGDGGSVLVRGDEGEG